MKLEIKFNPVTIVEKKGRQVFANGVLRMITMSQSVAAFNHLIVLTTTLQCLLMQLRDALGTHADGVATCQAASFLIEIILDVFYTVYYTVYNVRITNYETGVTGV